jgi:hypothetical protein
MKFTVALIIALLPDLASPQSAQPLDILFFTAG